MEFCFLNVFKPRGITSFDVIYKLRKKLGIKKIGHSGTLDPLAQGVMQVGIGQASRLLEYLNSDKEYIARIRFGFTSSTLDLEGEIIPAARPDFTKEDLICALEQFTGEITQTPPKFSAIKTGGKKLCDIARKNPDIKIDIPKRIVKIYKTELLEFANDTAVLKVECSKGTYIRTLAQDIAKKLGTDAYLTGLTRTRAGNFKIENSIQIENAAVEYGIEPSLALELKKYILNETEFNKVKDGAKIRPNADFNEGEIIQLIYNKHLVSIGILVDNMIKIKKFFNIQGQK